MGNNVYVLLPYNLYFMALCILQDTETKCPKLGSARYGNILQIYILMNSCEPVLNTPKQNTVHKINMEENKIDFWDSVWLTSVKYKSA